MIRVGTPKESIVEARAAIMEILNASVDGNVKIKAIDAITYLTKVDGFSISNCNFYGKADDTAVDDDPENDLTGPKC